MSRISPTDLPQPIYPAATVPGGLPPAPGPATVELPAAPTAHASVVPPRRSIPKAAIWIGAGIVAVVAAVVAVVLITTRGPGGGPPPPPTAAPGNAGAAHTSAATSSAVNDLVAGVQLTNAEYSCLYDDLDGRPELVAAINKGSFDTGQAADAIAGCVSAQTVADLLDVAFQSAGLDSVTAECIRTALGAMDQESLSSTVKALLDGDSTQLGKVLAGEAAYCFPAD